MNVQHRLFSVFGYHTLTHPLKNDTEFGHSQITLPLNTMPFFKTFGSAKLQLFSHIVFFYFLTMRT